MSHSQTWVAVNIASQKTRTRLPLRHCSAIVLLVGKQPNQGYIRQEFANN